MANTALGFGVIAVCDVVLRLRPEIANAIGYAAGWLLGYVLNRAFVFRNRTAHRVTAVRYGVAVIVAFLANQLALQAALRWAPPSPIGHVASQATGVIVYTGLMFVLCAAWVFREPRPAV